jgi:hypothetical protein
VDVAQPVRLLGHRRTLCVQRWPTGCVRSLIYLLLLYFTLAEELLIDFRELIGEHSGENMAEAVWQTMELYGLVGRVSVL